MRPKLTVFTFSTAILSLTGSSSAMADCPTSSAELNGHIANASRAFADLDVDGFTAARTAAQEALSCVDQPVSPESAASYHQMEALDAFLQRDELRGQQAFQAMLAADSSAELSLTVAPKSHSLREWLATARDAPGGVPIPVAVPDGSQFFVDGKNVTSRPETRAAIVQEVTEGQQVAWTVWLLPTEDLPPWSYKDRPELPSPPKEPMPSPKIALWAITSGLAATSGVLWGTTMSSRSKVNATATQIRSNTLPYSPEAQSEFEAQIQRARTLGYAAQTTTALTLGFGTAALVVKW